MKKKNFGYVLMLVLAVSVLMACGDNSEKRTGAGKVVLLGESYLVPEQEMAWNSVAQAFTAETGIEVELRRQGTWDDIPQALQAAKLGGEQIDLSIVGIGTVRTTLGPAGNTMDITDLMEPLLDRFPEGMLDSCYIGGRLWAFPFSDGSGTAFFYNKTMFDELGIQPPATFEDLVAISQTIREKKGIEPMVFHGKDTWGWPMFFFDTYAQVSANKSLEQVEAFLQGNREFTGKQEQDAILLIKSMFDAGIMNKNVLDIDSDGMRAVFAQQQAAMIFAGTWEYPVLSGMDMDFEIGAFVYPAMFSGAIPQHAYAVGDNAIQIPAFADPDNLENTMRFVEFITRPENAKTILTAGSNPIFEVVKGAIAETDAVTEYLNANLVPNSVMYLDWIWPSEINDEFCNVIPAVINGTMSAERAVQSVQNVYANIIREKNYSYNWWSNWSEADWAKVRPKSIPDLSGYMK